MIDLRRTRRTGTSHGWNRARTSLATPRRRRGEVAAAVAFACLLTATVAAAPSQQGPGANAPRPAVDALFAEWDRPGSPGCALGVIEGGELTYERGYGEANLDWQIPIETDTVFYVGSVSKQFTAAAIALLALDGRIGLDDDIREYFPEMPAYARPITVRHLVHHTSGIRDIYTLMALAGIRLEDVFSDEDAIALIAAQKETNFVPGSEYLYSNSGYFLLAQLVERVSGEPLREFAAARIFAPLGMHDTHFHDRPEHVVERRAISYRRDGGGFAVSYLGNFDKVGAGGLYTTVRDLLLWDRNFYTGDVGGQAFLDLIQTPGVLTGGEPMTYAFGLQVDEYRGLRTVGHSGSMMGFKAAFLQFPQQRTSVIITCNLAEIEPMELARGVADLYLADALGPVPAAAAAAPGAVAPGGGRQDAGAALSAAELAAYAGRYYSDELDVVYELRAEEGELWLRLRNTAPRPVIKLVDGSLRAGGWRLSFEAPQGGRAPAFSVDAGRVTHIRFVRR